MEENKEITFVEESKILTLNNMFIFGVIITLLVYYDTRDYVDLCYLGLIVFYYLRIKIHNWRRYK